MNILTQNGKMKKSQNETWDVYNFGIPAFLSRTGIKTCPKAGQCANGCYARNGTYRFGNVVNAYENRLALTQNENFVDLVLADLNLKVIQAKAKGKKCLIRIHDSGDFYSAPYWDKWRTIMIQRPDVSFYAYTKMVQFFNEKMSQNEIPHNFRLIYSYGGLEDSHIDTSKHYHSKVFQSETELLAAGYSDASQDDTVAAIGSNRNIGLVYHGRTSYIKTGWSKVSK